MYLIIFIILALPLILLAFSYLKFNKCKDLLNNLDTSRFYLYKNKNVSTSTQVGWKERFGSAIPCNIYFGDNEIHILPSRFSMLLIGTELPVTYLKTENKELLIEHSTPHEISFAGHTKPSSSAPGKWFEITITEPDTEIQKEILNRIKSWR